MRCDRLSKASVAGAFARELIERLVDQQFDVAAADSVPDPAQAGFGHAYGFVRARLLRDHALPIVPVMINTYYPPNQPTTARCYDFGRALRAAIERSGGDLRVAVIASGGLTHFVTDESLDRRVLDALENGTADTLGAIPSRVLNAGSSEISTRSTSRRPPSSMLARPSSRWRTASTWSSTSRSPSASPSAKR